MLRHSEERGVHTLTMDSGANALGQPLMAALQERMAALAENGAPPLLIASSHPTLFSPGWDLKRLISAGRDEVAAVLAAFDDLILTLFSYPGPTAAAISGHAVAGGCLLAMASDLRVMATGRPRLGLSELNLGVPVPAASLRVLRARLSAAALEEVVLRGEGCGAERARDLGLVHAAVAADQVATAVDARLRILASKPSRAYHATKEYLFGDMWSEMKRVSREAADEFLACWFEADTQQRIAETARSLGHP